MTLHKLDQAIILRTALPIALKFAHGQAGQVEGYASLFDAEPDAQNDVIAPGAFAKSLAAHARDATAPVMLWSHDPSAPIGRWTTLEEDRKGLRVVGQLNLDSSGGRDAYAHIKGGDVNGLSIGYRLPPGSATVRRDGAVTLSEIDLLEISVVAVPAARGARISGVKHLASQRELEQLLHGAGLAHGAAAKLASGGWPALTASTEPQPEIDEFVRLMKAGLADLESILKG